MNDCTVTVFNYHEATDTWRTTVFEGVSLYETAAENSTRDSGRTNGDNVELHIPVSRCKVHRYIRPKEYSHKTDPDGFFTFKPETDFFIAGDLSEYDLASDDEYDEGLYHRLNDTRDGVYMISSAAYFDLIPHFEIGGR